MSVDYFEAEGVADTPVTNDTTVDPVVEETVWAARRMMKGGVLKFGCAVRPKLDSLIAAYADFRIEHGFSHERARDEAITLVNICGHKARTSCASLLNTAYATASSRDQS